jgi:hypothetical protein
LGITRKEIFAAEAEQEFHCSLEECGEAIATRMGALAVVS